MRRSVLVLVCVAALGTAAMVTPETAQSVAGSVVPAAPDAWLSPTGGGGNAAANEGEHLLTAASAPRLTRRWQVGSDDGEAPAIYAGVMYAPVGQTLYARSVTTGATLWTAPLASGDSYSTGESLVGHVLLLPYASRLQRGGVSAVDVSTHRMIWSRERPASLLGPEQR